MFRKIVKTILHNNIILLYMLCTRNSNDTRYGKYGYYKSYYYTVVVVQQYDWGALENISVCEESYAPHDQL